MFPCNEILFTPVNKVNIEPVSIGQYVKVPLRISVGDIAKSFGDVPMWVGGHVKDNLLFFTRVLVSVQKKAKKKNDNILKKKSKYFVLRC